MEEVIVVAGTPIDTELGAEILKQNDYLPISCAVSDTPYQQTILQSSPTTLQDIVVEKVITLVQQYNNKPKVVFIYCNSLSVAINIEQLRMRLSFLTIISPLEVYQQIAHKYHHLALLGANSQCVGRIETFLYQQSDTLNYVNGIGCLDIVVDVENKLNPDSLIAKHALVEQINIFKHKGVEAIILGCTHFSYFHKELDNACHQRNIYLPIIEIGKEMLILLSENLVVT